VNATSDTATTRRPPVFIITTGRSGGTLLMRVLNASPGLVIWGEHNGFISHLVPAVDRVMGSFARQRIQAHAHQVDNLRSSTPIAADHGWSVEWANPFTAETFHGAFRTALEQLFAADLPPDVRWGFKEIQYGLPEVRLLSTLFPEASFVFLVRDPVRTLDSKLRTFVTGDVTQPQILQFIFQGTRFLNTVVQLMQQRDPRHTFLSYETLVADPRTTAAQLCERLAVDPVPDASLNVVLGAGARPSEPSPWLDRIESTEGFPALLNMYNVILRMDGLI